MQESDVVVASYIPLVPVLRITAIYKLGRIPIASASKPKYPCGIAKRIGYTGTRIEDLAMYRLRVQKSVGERVMTLPMLFVVDDGIFVEYEEWQKRQGM